MPLYPSLVAFVETNVPELAGRVGPLPLPSGQALPALTYTQVAAPRRYTLGGDAGLVTERVQLDLWTRSYYDAARLSDALVAVLSGYKGPLWDVQIEALFVANVLDRYEPETELRGKLIDLRVTWKEL